MDDETKDRFFRRIAEDNFTVSPHFSTRFLFDDSIDSQAYTEKLIERIETCVRPLNCRTTRDAALYTLGTHFKERLVMLFELFKGKDEDALECFEKSVRFVRTLQDRYGKEGVAETAFMVDLHEDPTTDEYVLALGNSGEPFTEDIDFDHPNTLGLRLVSALARQLDGFAQLARYPHLLFTVRFPRETAADEENVHDDPSGRE
jgi:hypothetical protein